MSTCVGKSTYKYRGGYRTTYTYKPIGPGEFKDRIGKEGASRTKPKIRPLLRERTPNIRGKILYFKRKDLNIYDTKNSIVDGE